GPRLSVPRCLGAAAGRVTVDGAARLPSTPRSLATASTRKAAAGVFPRRRLTYQLKLVGQHERENDRGEGEPLDEGRRDDHVGADAAAGLGLAGDALDGLATDLADAAGAAEDGDAHAD